MSIHSEIIGKSHVVLEGLWLVIRKKKIEKGHQLVFEQVEVSWEGKNREFKRDIQW